MCFTISVEKKAKEEIRKYVLANEGMEYDVENVEDYYLVSGFAHPVLPVIRQGGIIPPES